MNTNFTPDGKITSDFARRNDTVLSTKSWDIYTAMLKNANFPNPTPTMPDVLAVVQDYNDALAAAQTRERTAVAVKNQKRSFLIVVQKQLPPA